MQVLGNDGHFFWLLAVPYYCAEGSLVIGVNCMTVPWLHDVDDMVAQAELYSAAGEIDDTANLDNKRVFVWHGGIDYTVNQGL